MPQNKKDFRFFLRKSFKFDSCVPTSFFISMSSCARVFRSGLSGSSQPSFFSTLPKEEKQRMFVDNKLLLGYFSFNFVPKITNVVSILLMTILIKLNQFHYCFEWVLSKNVQLIILKAVLTWMFLCDDNKSRKCSMISQNRNWSFQLQASVRWLHLFNITSFARTYIVMKSWLQSDP